VELEIFTEYVNNKNLLKKFLKKYFKFFRIIFSIFTVFISIIFHEQIASIARIMRQCYTELYSREINRFSKESCVVENMRFLGPSCVITINVYSDYSAVLNGLHLAWSRAIYPRNSQQG